MSPEIPNTPPVPEYSALVVDGSYLLHRILHAGGSSEYQAYQAMQTSSGTSTGGVYGCIKSLRAALNHIAFQVRSIVVVWDGRPKKLSQRRVQIWEHYKNDPSYVPTEEDHMFRSLYSDQRPRVEQMLKLLGISSINIPEREGDDVVANVLPLLAGRLLVMSDDRDYFQLVSPRVHVYRAIKDVVITPENFFDKTNIKDPRRYLLYAAICGDGSDNIPGIIGVGDTTAQRVANAIDLDSLGRFTYPNFLKVIDSLKVSDKRGATRYDRLRSAIQTVTRNLMLMDLFLEKLDLADIESARQQLPASFDEQQVLHWFTSYEFKSYLDNFHQWSMPFRMLEVAKLV